MQIINLCFDLFVSISVFFISSDSNTYLTLITYASEDDVYLLNTKFHLVLIVFIIYIKNIIMATSFDKDGRATKKQKQEYGILYSLYCIYSTSFAGTSEFINKLETKISALKTSGIHAHNSISSSY